MFKESPPPDIHPKGHPLALPDARPCSKGMEERGLSPRRDPPRDEPQQLRREPAATRAGARAYAANLGEAGRLEPFARHRDQPARLAHPDEAAQDVRAREERDRKSVV